MWAGAEDFSLAQAYVASKVAEDILGKVTEGGGPVSENMGSKGPVVIGNIEDDFHPLGRTMVVAFLRAAGWRVCDLGNDVTAKEFVDKAVEVDARIVGASAMMYTTAKNIRKLREEIDRRGLTGRVQLELALQPGTVSRTEGLRDAEVIGGRIVDWDSDDGAFFI